MSSLKHTITILLCLIFFLAAFQITGCDFNVDDNGDYITITDMLGEKIRIKKNPQKVACASRTTYDLLIAFGLEECIDGVYYALLDNKWAPVFDKNINNRYSLAYQESYETYISRNVDLVFSPEKYITDGLKERGISAATISLYGNPDFRQYVYYFADLVKQIWDLPSVASKVDAWIEHMKNTIANIQDELSKHDIKQKKVYYIRGDKNNGVGYTDQKRSFTEYAYKILGTIPLNDQFETNRPSAEEICSQNPDIFVVGGIYQKELISELQKEPYVNLNAVKEDKIYNIPIGLTAFEQISVFSPAFFYDQANKIYPEYFEFNVKKKIQDLSKEFFDVDLSDTEVENMLNGVGRDGKTLI